MKCPSCKGVGTVNGIFNCPSCKGIGIIKNKQVDSNEMPELKAGMIVETKEGLKFIYINDNFALGLKGSNFNIDPKKYAVKIYDFGFNYPLNRIEDNLTIIWSKNKSKIEEIEEIEQTILKLQQEVKELKNDN